MAVRLMSVANLRHLNYIQSIPKLLSKSNQTKSLAFLRQVPWSPVSYQRIQALHEKVLDKDAGFDARREAMKTDIFKDNNDGRNDETYLSRNESRTRTRRGNPRKSTSNLEEKSANSELKNPNKEETISASEIRPKEKVDWGSDPNTFGGVQSTQNVEDEGDIEEENFIKSANRRGKKLRTREYAQMIKDHLKARNLKEALNVLEVRILKEDRAKPENYIYNLLISGCAKEGYARKAFKLFSNMRKRGLKVKPSTYTSLFNACANAPGHEDGLAKATYLREYMIEKAYEPNVVNYNAMIKAFGRWGDVQTAYLLADEMLDKNLEMTLETYNFLLQACASDKQNGFRYCLLTWHKILQKGFKPDYYTFLSVLRCVRDSGMGDLEKMQQVLQQILENEHKILYISAEKTSNQKQLTAGTPVNDEEKVIQSEPKIAIQTKDHEIDNVTYLPLRSNNQNPFNQDSEVPNKNPFGSSANNSYGLSTEVATSQPTQVDEFEAPNLLLRKPHLGSLVELSEVRLPHERFLLLGGLNGFLATMKEYQVTPDIETFTIILENIPATNAAEKQVIAWIRKIGLKADIDFFNILIKKRSMRFDYDGAKEVLSMIKTAGLYPDIVTYGVLALGCQTEEEANELLQRMKQNGIRMNVQILGAMLRQGCVKKNFNYINQIMQICLDERIKPNEQFLRHLHKFKLQCARAIDARHPLTKPNTYKKGHAQFCDKLRLFYEEHGIENLKLEDAIKKLSGGPYDHYKEAKVDGIEPLKNEKKAKKSKLRKYIKKIKLSNLKDDPDYQSPRPDNLKQIK